MSLPVAGPNLKLTDAGNGRVTVAWVNGNPVFDDAQAEAVFSLLMEPDGWFGDRAKKRRTLIPTIRSRDAGTPGRLIQYARDAVQPLIDDGRLQSVEPSVTPTANGYTVTVAYVTGGGQQASVTVPLKV